jgi:aminomethyltransferase
MNTAQVTEVPRLSPIDAAHRACAATFTEFAGWRLPLRYAGDLTEHRAVRDSAGLFDVSHMGQIVVEGRDAAPALAGALVSDVGRLATGRARYTMLCREDGGVVDDLIVYRIDQDEFLVIANAGNTDAVRDRLVERSAGRHLSIEDRTSERALFSIQGPDAARILATCLQGSTELPRRFGLQSSLLAGRKVLVARTGYTGEDGFEISVGAGDAEFVWRRLLEGGGTSALLPAGLAARDSLRLEAGLPLYGHELSLQRTPFAAGYGHVVDLGRPFVGEEALAEVARRSPDEVLVGLVCAGERSPRAGYLVSAADGRPIGVVTSGGPSPTLGVPIAMAYVNRLDAVSGARVSIDVRGRVESAVVSPLPFYSRAKGESVLSALKPTRGDDRATR